MIDEFSEGRLLFAPLQSEKPKHVVRNGKFADEWPFLWKKITGPTTLVVGKYAATAGYIPVARSSDLLEYSTRRASLTISTKAVLFQRILAAFLSDYYFMLGFESATKDLRYVISRAEVDRIDSGPTNLKFNFKMSDVRIYAAGTVHLGEAKS